MNTSENRKHSKISPSKLKNLEICPSWCQDETQEEHPLTLRGSAMHLALETGNDSGLKVEDGEVELVNKCREFERQFEGQEVLREVKIDITGGIFGYVDTLYFDGPLATLNDYKFSAAKQEAVETNPAAQAYTLGVVKNWLQVGQVQVNYLYPRFDEIDQTVYTRNDIPAIELRIATIVARVRASKKKRVLNPTVDNCLYCGNKATCSALHAIALPIATRYAAKKDLAMPAEYDPALISDPAQMSKAKALASVLSKWCESVDFHAMKLRLDDGVEIPGYELRTRSGRKKITNPLKAWEVAENYVTQDQFLAACDVNVKALGEAAAERAAKGEKKKMVDELEDRLRDAGVMEIGVDVSFLQKAKV